MSTKKLKASHSISLDLNIYLIILQKPKLGNHFIFDLLFCHSSFPTRMPPMHIKEWDNKKESHIPPAFPRESALTSFNTTGIGVEQQR
jgi:hypothetical protein